MKPLRQAGMFWVIATLCVAMAPQLASMPLSLVILALVPVGWRLAAELRGWRPLPIFFRVLVTVLTVFALVATHGSLFGRRIAVSLLTLMLALKLLETFRVRDARVIASLCLFLCATQFLFTQGILMLVYGAATLTSALVALLYLQRWEAFMPVGEAPARGRSLFADLGYGVRLMILAIPTAIALFLLFPRWSTPMWGMPESALDARSGLSDSMAPGSIQNLFMDDSPAFRSEFQGAVPARSEMYWRGPVFWDFDGREWTRGYYGRGLRAESLPSVSGAPWRYTVQIEPTEQHWIFTLDYPALVPRGTYLTMDYQLFSRRSITQVSSYEMVSNPNFTDAPQLLNQLRRRALDLPDGFNPRTRELMRQWRAETPDDRRLVDRVLGHFNQEDFYYTLNPPLLSRHTVDEFLFETRAGFCEHYASTFAVMMRMAGIPARVVTGYQGGWYSEFGQYVLVRQSNAHAWAEVWLEGSGWARVDPTAAVAPNRVSSGPLEAVGGRRYLLDFAWLRNMRNGFDILQRRWNDLVIAFNAERQQSLFRPFGLGDLDARKLVLILFLAIGLIMVVILPAILRFRPGGETDPAARLWQKFRKKLARAGVETLASHAPTELAEAAARKHRPAAADIRQIADLYRRIRYARHAPQLQDLARAVRKFNPSSRRSRT
jgi:transglutaminase-like putative cysteine protease